MRISIVLAVVLAACGTPKPLVATTPEAPAPPTPIHKPAHAVPPPVEPRKPLLAIDWDHTPSTTDAEALAVWRLIAPTGADWEQKLAEIPTDKPVAHALAIALLHEGNFACGGPVRTCATHALDVSEPRPDSTLAEPCLRRLLGLWAIDQLEDTDLPAVKPSLEAIAALPPPESQLVVAALAQFPEADQDARLHALVVAWGAGQHDLVNAVIGSLDEPHLIAAAQKHHIDGAVEVLSPVSHRAIFLGAILDDRLGTQQRQSAITEIATADPKLAPDARATLVKAAASPDCVIAAAAAHALDNNGDHRFVPRRPHTRSEPAMMRALCVLASYEPMQRNDEPSLLQTYVPKDGLEETKVSYDAYSETDPDGDGDVHTEHIATRLEHDEIVLANADDVARALRHCTSTTCSSDDRDFRFTFKLVAGELMLTRLEIAERPPCLAGTAP